MHPGESLPWGISTHAADPLLPGLQRINTSSLGAARMNPDAQKLHRIHLKPKPHSESLRAWRKMMIDATLTAPALSLEKSQLRRLSSTKSVHAGIIDESFFFFFVSSTLTLVDVEGKRKREGVEGTANSELPAHTSGPQMRIRNRKKAPESPYISVADSSSASTDGQSSFGIQ